MRRRLLLSTPLVLAAAFGAWAWAQSASAGASTLPARLSDQAYWRMIEQFSEPNGYFRSDNLVSNEDLYQTVIPRLQVTVGRGDVYVGVGPDQNFTYIAAVRPRIAFIPDIRRGNLLLHLMYKALFEQSADRAEFLSRLFSRPRPPDLGPASDIETLFEAYAVVPADRALFQTNLAAIAQTLLDRHGFPLTSADLAGIDRVYSAFFNEGPFLAYSSNGFSMRGRYPTYQDLQLADDGTGVRRGYLASEASFRLLKNMHQQNLIVPLVGNFAGPKTLQAVGEYLSAHRSRRHGVLYVQCRTVPVPGRFMAVVHAQRPQSAARRDEHVHPIVLQQLRAATRHAVAIAARFDPDPASGRGHGRRRQLR